MDVFQQYSLNRTLYGDKKEWSTTMCNSMKKSHKCKDEINKTDNKENTHYNDSIYMKFKNR